MATNYVREGDTSPLAVGAGIVSGAPVVINRIIGVALTTRDADGYSTIQHVGVFDLSVKAVDEDGNSAVAIGDPIYYVAADTPKLSKKQSGVMFGFALETIGAGETDTINVRLQASPGATETGAVQARDVTISGVTTLADWRKAGDLTKIDGADISNGTIPAAALAADVPCSDVVLDGVTTLDTWRKAGDLTKIDGAKVSAGTLPSTAVESIAPAKIPLEGATALDSWQKAGDLTKLDGAKVSTGTLPSAAIDSVAAAKVVVDGATMLSDWRKAGDLTKLDGAKVSTGTLPSAAIENVAAGKVILDGVTGLDSWQKAGDLTKIDGAKLSDGTVLSVAIATLVASKVMLDGATGLDTWQKGGDLTKFDGAKVSAGTIPNSALVNKVTRNTICIPCKLTKIAAADVLTQYRPGYAGTIKKFSFAVTDPATTGGKAADLNLEINDTNLTGGVLNLTTAKCAALGAVEVATDITANNVFGDTDTISIEGSGVTPFIEGEGVFLIEVEVALQA